MLKQLNAPAFTNHESFSFPCQASTLRFRQSFPCLPCLPHPFASSSRPLQADLGDLRGLSTGLDGRNSSMINGGEFDGAKAYKDSKVCVWWGAAFGCSALNVCIRRAHARTRKPCSRSLARCHLCVCGAATCSNQALPVALSLTLTPSPMPQVCNMLTMRQLHQRLHESTGVTFATLYPGEEGGTAQGCPRRPRPLTQPPRNCTLSSRGRVELPRTGPCAALAARCVEAPSPSPLFAGCIAETGLFRNHIPLFRTLFPPFQKFVTKGYVSEAEAGRRLAQVVSDPALNKSGVYWSWDNDKSSLWFDSVGDSALENTLSEEASNDAKGAKLYDLSLKLVGLA